MLTLISYESFNTRIVAMTHPIYFFFFFFWLFFSSSENEPKEKIIEVNIVESINLLLTRKFIFRLLIPVWLMNGNCYWNNFQFVSDRDKSVGVNFRCICRSNSIDFFFVFPPGIMNFGYFFFVSSKVKLITQNTALLVSIITFTFRKIFKLIKFPLIFDYFFVSFSLL